MFDCAGQPAVGVVSVPAGDAPSGGIVIVVGGPQYRIGSHRQFVHLARSAASQGMAVLRFDYRGMGDSWDALRDFEGVEADVRSAVDVFFREVPSMKQVVLWGLCDGASASCLHAPAQDARIAGLILVNPWVHTAAGEAATRLKHYYLKRLTEPAFWRKLLRGGVSMGRSLSGLRRTLGQLFSGKAGQGAVGVDSAGASSADGPAHRNAAGSLPQRMAARLKAAGHPVAIALSGDDRVAREFEDVAMPMREWRDVLQHQLLSLERIPQADHTLSSLPWKEHVARWSIHWASHMTRAGERATASSPEEPVHPGHPKPVAVT